MRANEFLTEKWSQKYKSSINCSHPKGFSQKAHCAGKKKHNESITMESVCPDCGMCQTHGNLNEIKKGQKDANGFTRCWPGKHAVGTKKGKNGGQVRNCEPNEGVAEAVDIGREWMSDTELDQYVPERLQQQWRELLGYDRNGNPSALWANLTGGYEPDSNDPQHRALMVKVANKWFAAKKIPNVKFFDVKDADDDDELEWLVQIGQQGVAEGSLNEFDPGEGGFGPFKLYKGSPHHYDHIDTFSSLNAAEEEMEFQKDMAAQEGSIDYYKIIDGTGEEVGGFDPDNAYDDMRRGSKIQNRKPGEQGVAEDLELEEQFNIIESMVEYWAEHHGVDSDTIWEDLESVDDEELLSEAEAWQKSSGKNKNGGLNKKGVASYRRSHPGSHLQTAVTTKPSKLKKGSKAAKRRKSFCARMKGMKKHRAGAKTKRDPNSRINKSLRKWHCE